MKRSILFVLATLSLTGNAFAGHSELAMASPDRLPVQVPGTGAIGGDPGRDTSKAVEAPLGDTTSQASVPSGSPIGGPYVMGERHYALNGSMLAVAKETPVVSKDEWATQCARVSGKVVGAGLGFCVLAVGENGR